MTAEVEPVARLVVIGLFLFSASVGLLFSYVSLLPKLRGTLSQKVLRRNLAYIGYDLRRVKASNQMGSTYEKDVLTTVKRQPGQKRPNNWFEPVIGLGENHPRIGEFAVDKDGGIVTWAGHAYIVSAVRRRSTFAIKQEAEYFASGKVEELEEAEYPLASYLFAAQSATAKPLSEGMALYCYRNQVSPAVMTLAGHLPLKVFENIKDLPISWVKEFLSEGN
jgi:hypothetical protein